MASSDNKITFEPFLLSKTFHGSWISEAHARETETLTKALQKSLSSTETVSDLISIINPFLDFITDPPNLSPTPTASNFSGSEPETPSGIGTTPPVLSKRNRNGNIPGPTNKVTKRKSRASKKSQTTFITADPANFRQMVQQVTGVRFGNSQLPVVPVLKPEPQRIGNRLPGAPGCLPTLDTSAFLLDHNQQQMIPGSGSGSGSVFSESILGDGGLSSGLDFDTISSFPTLESCTWKVM